MAQIQFGNRPTATFDTMRAWLRLVAAGLLATRALAFCVSRPARTARPMLASAQRDDPEKLEWRLLKSLRRCSGEFEMICEGDKIAVAVSGGKDSATMLYLLEQIRSRRLLPFDFDFVAVHLDQEQPGHDPSSLKAWVEGLGIEYHLVREDTYSIVTEKTAPGKTYCSLCSRLRRGILYTTALSLGCNRLALGHHRDDALETLLLNMLHMGQLKAMPARYHSETRGIDVIRPLMYCAEDDIAAFAAREGFPILPCNLCGTQPDSQRREAKMMLAALDGLGDGSARKNMLRAISDVRPTHLLDRELREACGLDRSTGDLVDDRGKSVVKH